MTDARGSIASSADTRLPRTVENDADVVFHDNAEEGNGFTSRKKSNNDDGRLVLSKVMDDF